MSFAEVMVIIVVDHGPAHVNALTWREDDSFLINAKRSSSFELRKQRDGLSMRETAMSTWKFAIT